MPLTCTLCSRPNPAEALYCYYDGVALGGGAAQDGPVAVASQSFATPFYFPSGAVCRTFDELARACEAHWEEACDLLRDELLAGFFSGLGRSDLAFAARRAAAEPDLDLALDRLLTQLPGAARAAAQVAVRPPQINVGRVARGAEHRFVVRIQNVGMGLLCGSVTCGDCDWLALGDDAGAPHKVFQCRREMELPVRVVGKRLRAGRKALEAQLHIETNGGSAVVVVQAEAPAVVPFAQGILAGAQSPRMLAEKTRAAPREAAPLFENGAVADWYQANGWTYPVQGPLAAGVAGVQQFFEALGLATPPRVELEHSSLYVEGPPGAALETAVVVHTSEHRPVFAYAATDDPWLTVGPAVLKGPTARIPLYIAAVPGCAGDQLHGRVRVTANGFQRFTVPITLSVTAGTPHPMEQRAETQVPAWSGPTAPLHESLPTRSPGRPGLLVWVFAIGFLLAAAAAVVAVAAFLVLTPPAETTAPVPVVQGTPPSTPIDAPDPEKDPKTTDPALPPTPLPPPPLPPTPPPPPPPPPPAPGVSELVKLLDSEEPLDRVTAARRLGAKGRAAAAAIHPLLAALKRPDAALRREALLDLPKIGAPTGADADLLGDLVAESSFPEGRRYALAALIPLGADAKPALLALCGALRDRDAAVRRQAAMALGAIGPEARDLGRRDLIAALRDADPGVTAAAMAALDKMGPPTITDAASLQVLLQDKAEAARRFALKSFNTLGPDAADFAAYLEDSVTGDASPELRLLAIGVLMRMAPAARRTADALTRALADKDVEVCRAAAAALAQMGVEHGATAGLVQALGSEDEATSKSAEDALKGAKLSEAQVRSVGEALRTKNAAVRLRIIELLTPLGADAAPAVPGLCVVLKDGPGEPRQQAFVLLTAMGKEAHRASGALEDLLKDDQFAVRMEAAVALATIEGADAEAAAPVLIEALQVDKLDDADDAARRDRAVEALGHIGAPAVRPLTAALEGTFSKEDPTSVKGQINIQARLAALKALGLIGPAAGDIKTQIVLNNLQLKDPSKSVREAAKQARALTRKPDAGK